MIANRPKYLEENLKYYKEFPIGFNLDADYHKLPPLLNLDFHTLNGILPLTKSRFDFIGKNGNVEDQESTVIFTNPLPEEYEYYESIGATEFQAIQIVMNFHTLKEERDKALRGIPYSISLVPMEKNKKIDTWNINLLKQFDLEKLCQEGGYVYSDFNPFQGWYDGYVSHYNVFSSIPNKGYSDCIGFVWGMYFLSPVFDKKEVQIIENPTFSKQINAKYRRFKTDLYFKQFQDTRPRRIWGCDSPIELFVLQGLSLRELYPEIQMCFYKNREIFPNYYQMQENEIWVGQEQLITSADFYFPEKKLAIFCDGKEFHDEMKDKEISKKLNDIGVDVLRFSGKQINEDLTSVLDEIEKRAK
ncbi:DUF559 domain-containing protein [Cyclobacterium qasimii]|uniref:DUF559 domain-containing protein n=2 Tax=Cyclobacterium qasimii TaxID=1350429 RepID=S7VIP9_9BACT|nr:DUF559 domain-containing protein [Cyclobacterium qasimii]EPR69387.1 hypothetical protein ADICYQ_1489 [Cyclobacterium qasimii M12-11B]GEO24125.1 hypothetical protein CQA01_46590 [Cyclobacterium qasimii]